MTRVAAIDCGTNSIRLLVADGETQGERVILNDLTRQMRIALLPRQSNALSQRCASTSG